MRKLAIIGAGELGKLVAHHASNDAGYEIAGYYDDFSTAAVFNGFPVLGSPARVLPDYSAGLFDALFIGIGYARMEARIDYFSRFKGKVPFANILHSSSYIDKSCQVGEGIFVLPGVTLDFETVIEDNVLINTGGTIAHHTKIGQHSFLGPAVQLAGIITVEEGCFIGLGATIVDCLTVGKGSVIGAGSVVLANTEPGSVNVGVPAKRIK